MYKKSFTLIELVLVIAIASLILPLIFFVYLKIQKDKRELDGQQKLIQQTYNFVERLNVLLQDYTIDYEEYFNRQMVGCTNGWEKGNAFDWKVNGSGYCDSFTAYGNGSTNSFLQTGSTHEYYYCSSQNTMPVALPSTVDGVSCSRWSFQSYGQYKWSFWDVKDDVDGDNLLVGDSDDEDKWEGLVAIRSATGVQELYLISQDGKHRLYFRRNLVEEYDRTGDGIGTGEQKYVIQMLKLKGFDAGRQHNFEIVSGSTNPWLYDGQIDTWACDASQGFMGAWKSLSGAYANYKLPVNADDCWVDLDLGSLSISAWNFSLSPTSDPVLAWSGQNSQINPVIILSLFSTLYYGSGEMKFPSSLIPSIPLQTTFNTKNFYS